MQAVHRHLTQDLVDWAGQLRTVDIAKADMFCPVQHLRSYAAEVFGRLAELRLLTGRSRDDFVSGLAELYGDLNALHPFREFNGRAQRAFISQLSAQAGWRVSWRDMSPEANVAASVASFRGRTEPLRELLDKLVTPLTGPDRQLGRDEPEAPVQTIGDLLDADASFPPELGKHVPAEPGVPGPAVPSREVDLGR